MAFRRITPDAPCVHLTVRVPPVLADALADTAEREGRTVAAVVRDALARTVGLGHLVMAERPPASSSAESE